MDLEKIIELAKIIAKPYKITTIVLSLLLFVSIVLNVYLLKEPVVVNMKANGNNSSFVTQSQEG